MCGSTGPCCNSASGARAGSNTPWPSPTPGSPASSSGAGPPPGPPGSDARHAGPPRATAAAPRRAAARRGCGPAIPPGESGRALVGGSMRSFSAATVAVLVWLAVALAIDRWVLTPYCATCARALALELKVQLPATELTYPPVSVLVLIVFPMLVLALFLVPWRQPLMGSAWRQSFVRC